MSDDMKRRGMENRTEGAIDEATGRIRDAAGGLTGDTSQQMQVSSPHCASAGFVPGRLSVEASARHHALPQTSTGLCLLSGILPRRGRNGLGESR